MNDKTYSYECGGRTLGPFTAMEIVQLVHNNLLEPNHTVVDSERKHVAAGEVRLSPAEKDEAVPPPLHRPTGPLPWNPITIAWLGLAFSPIWSAVMSAVNTRRLGMSLPIWRPILIAVGLLLLDVVIGLLLFGSVLVSLSLFLGALWLIWRMDLRPQLPAYGTRSATSRSGPSWLVPAIAGGPCAVVVFLMFIVAPLIPSEPGWLVAYDEGLLLLETDDVEAAVSKFSEAISLNPRSFEAYNGRGLAHRESGSTTQALRDFDIAVELAPDADFVYYNRGLTHGDDGNYDKAIDDFSEAIRLCPDEADAYCHRGIARLQNEGYDQAIDDLTRALELEPNDAIAHNTRAVAHMYRGESASAINDLTEAIRLRPDFAEAYSNRGIVRLQNEEYDEAIADLTRALEIEPNEALAHNMRGVAYCEKGQYTRAIADFDEALRLEPDYAEARENRSRAEEAKLASATKGPSRWPGPSMPEFPKTQERPRSDLARATPFAARGAWHAVKNSPSGAKTLGKMGKGFFLVLMAIAGAVATFVRGMVKSNGKFHSRGR